jgi:hypothetical protein
VVNYSNVHMMLSPKLLDGAMAPTGQQMTAQIMYASIELKMYAAFSELLAEHNLDGCCRRTVWNRHLPDHHSLLVVLARRGEEATAE